MYRKLNYLLGALAVFCSSAVLADSCRQPVSPVDLNYDAEGMPISLEPARMRNSGVVVGGTAYDLAWDIDFTMGISLSSATPAESSNPANTFDPETSTLRVSCAMFLGEAFKLEMAVAEGGGDISAEVTSIKPNFNFQNNLTYQVDWNKWQDEKIAFKSDGKVTISADIGLIEDLGAEGFKINYADPEFIMWGDVIAPGVIGGTAQFIDDDDLQWTAQAIGTQEVQNIENNFAISASLVNGEDLYGFSLSGLSVGFYRDSEKPRNPFAGPLIDILVGIKDLCERGQSYGLFILPITPLTDALEIVIQNTASGESMRVEVPAESEEPIVEARNFELACSLNF